MLPPNSSRADPFQPPASPISTATAATAGLDAVALRRLGVRREGVIRSLGLVLSLVAVWSLVLCCGELPRTVRLLVGMSLCHPTRDAIALLRGLGFPYAALLIAALLEALGSGLRRLATWARWSVLGLAAVLLLALAMPLVWLASRGLGSASFIELAIPSVFPGLLLASTTLLLTGGSARLIFSEP